jgi:hypothetical protein
MRNRVSKILPLAFAAVLVAVGSAFAGQNAGVVVTLTTPTEFSGVGAGSNSVTLTLHAEAMSSVKQMDITLAVTPADAFDLSATMYTPPTGFIVPGMEIDAAAGTVKVGAANFFGSISGGADIGTFVLKASSTFSASTSATVVVRSISLGPTSSDRDVFGAAALGLEVTVNPPAPAPTISGIAPAAGTVAGGTAVVISGANFADGAAVAIGGVAATSVVVVDAGQITAVTGAGAVGAADVVVSNADGKSGTLAAGFTYEAIPAPAISGVSPSTGPVAGGTTVTISGASFQAGATVAIGGIAATGVTFGSAASLTAVTPARTAEGSVDVVVSNPDGQSATLAGAFTYFSTIEPRLLVVGAADPVPDYSGIGEGGVADGSAGEVRIAANFRDATGAPAAGQAITFMVLHNGGETVYVLSPVVQEIPSGGAASIVAITDALGTASIRVDSEGNRDSQSTSLSITASTSAPNSDGVMRNLSVGFSVTWDVPVVAELASLGGSVMPSGAVVLEWSVVSQTSNLGWQVLRSTDNVNFAPVGELVRGAGTSDAFLTYSFTDTEVPSAQVVYYALSQIDLDGSSHRSSVVMVSLADAVAVPTRMALLQNYPNPFNPGTTIAFDVNSDAVVTLRVFDLTGQVVRTLVSGERFSPGRYERSWDGRNEAGVRVASGVYFYQLATDGFGALRKMTLVQ